MPAFFYAFPRGEGGKNLRFLTDEECGQETSGNHTVRTCMIRTKNKLSFRASVYTGVGIRFSPFCHSEEQRDEESPSAVGNADFSARCAWSK